MARFSLSCIHEGGSWGAGLRLTVPGRPRSARPRSNRGPHRTWSSTSSANLPQSCWEEVLHHQMANPAGLGTEKCCQVSGENL